MDGYDKETSIVQGDRSWPEPDDEDVRYWQDFMEWFDSQMVPRKGVQPWPIVEF